MKASKHIYLSFMEIGTGIYKSQVLDVVDALNRQGRSKGYAIRLVAFAPLRTFQKNRSWIKSFNSRAIVLPTFPRIKNWPLNRWILKLLLLFLGTPKTIIARSVLATNLAQSISGVRVIYDGRGSIWKEAEEYDIFAGALNNEQVFQLEQRALEHSSYHLAVSSQLVAYWKEYYGYTQENHVVIPCTLSESHHSSETKITRADWGWKEDDVVLVFSGSLAGWQSLDHLIEPLTNLMDKEDCIRLLFLSKENELCEQLSKRFPEKVKRFWLDHQLVFSYLQQADYGILLRARSVTNQVASPVKYAEYLSAGLKVLVSDGIGDFSSFTKENEVGVVLKEMEDIESIQLHHLSPEERKRSRDLAFQYFHKGSENIQNKFDQLITYSLEP